MKKKQILFIVLGIIILIALIAGIVYHFRDRRTYCINIPTVSNLKSITLEKSAEGKSYSDDDNINDIINVIGGVKRITQKESINDYPTNANDIIKVDFYFKDTGSSTLFVYNKNGKYYIEQPYNGIYEIREEEYNLIDKYLVNIESGTKVKNFEIIFYDKLPEEMSKKTYKILDKSETEKYDYNIYGYNGSVNITIDGKEFPLKEALLENQITMEEIITKANKDIPNAVSYDDGGSMEYHYDNYTIIKCNTLDGNRDVYIGDKTMTLKDVI